jgi:orotidine-5'-phosphate decarboxylase
VEDFDQDLIDQLTRLSKEHDFLIFEDRKFADIGNTVSLQYSSGVHKIASWSQITDAHLIPGSGIITGLAKVGKPLGRGLLLLAEMSSAGNLATGDYTRACVQEAERDESGYVMGFIAMGRVDEKYATEKGKKRDFLILTPGVGMDVTGDSMGQQYRTPDQVIGESGCDVMIVGRGIYGALMQDKVLGGDAAAREQAVAKVKEQGERYKQAGWQAYLKRIGVQKGA